MSMLGALNKFLFNYHTLDVHLVPPTRSLVVTLKRPQVKNAINNEMIFELETLCTWLMEHSEVHCVLFKGRGGYFSAGFDLDEVRNMELEALQKLIIRFQKLTHSLFELPQTLIFDMGSGAAGAGLELSAAADIRLAAPEATFSFNQLGAGLPISMGLMAAVMDRSLLRYASFGAHELPVSTFVQGGYIHDVDAKAEKYQKIIAKQSPVARIQARRALKEAMKADLERARVYDKTTGLGAIETLDFKKADYKEFIKARDFAQQFDSNKETVSSETRYEA